MATCLSDFSEHRGRILYPDISKAIRTVRRGLCSLPFCATDFGAVLLAFGIRAVPELNPSAHVEKYHQCISGHAHPVDGDSSEYSGDGYMDSRGFLCPICRLPASGIAGDIQSTIGDHQWSGDHTDVHIHRSLFVDADG